MSATAPKHHYTEDELELLTDEEREGLLDPNFVDDPVDGAETTDDTNDGDDDAAKAAAEEAAAAAAAEAARKAGEPPAGEPAKPAAAAPSAAPAPTVPVYTAPADLKDQIGSLEQQVDALDKKFDEGELTAAELRQQTRDLERQIRELERTGERAQLSKDAQAATWENETVAQFLSSNAAYQPGTFLYQALDIEVRKLQVGEFKDNPFAPDILDKAHQNITAGLAALGGKPQPKDDPNKPQRQIPPSLGGLPTAADDPLSDSSDFAFIDRLTGVEYEEALAKLSDADRDAYLAR